MGRRRSVTIAAARGDAERRTPLSRSGLERPAPFDPTPCDDRSPMSKRRNSAGGRVPLSLPVVVTIRDDEGVRRIEVDGTQAVTIGRAEDSTIVLRTSRASRHHAEIIGEGGLFTLIDQDSANGTIVDGKKVTSTSLDAGSVIRIGETRITFGDAGGAAPRTARPSLGRGRAGSTRPAPRGAPSTAPRPATAARPPAPGPRAPSVREESAPSPPTPRRSTPAEPAKRASRAPAPTAKPTPAASDARPAPTLRAGSSSRSAAPPAVVDAPTGAGQKVATGFVAALILAAIAWTLGELAQPMDPRERETIRAATPTASVGEEPAREESGAPPRPEERRGGAEPGEFRPLDLSPTEVPAGEADDAPEVERRTRRPDAMELEAWLRENRELGVGETPEAPIDPGADVTFDGTGDAAAEMVERPLVRIIPDGWPPGARTVGYEYNQKNHGATPTFVGRDGSALPERNAARHARQYRVIGVEVLPRLLPADTPVALRSKQIEKGELVPLRLPEPAPGAPAIPERLRRFFAIEEPEDLRVLVEVVSVEGREVLATAEMLLPPGGRTTPLITQAVAIQQERQREEWERSKLTTRTVAVQVLDDQGLPLPGARVMLVIEGGGLITFDGETDESGVYRTAVVPGAYTVLVHGDVPEVEQPGMTRVDVVPRVLSVQGRLGSDETEVRIEPKRKVRLEILAEGETRLPIERIVVTPGPIAEAYKYERVVTEIGERGRLQLDRTAPGGVDLLLGDQPVELGLLGRTPDGEPVLITERILPDRRDLTWNFRRSLFSRIEFDPARSFGGVKGVKGEVVAVSAHRERFSFDASEPWRAWVMPGKYRITLDAEVEGGTARFLPYATEIASGQTHDLTPRGPWSLTLYQKKKDRQQQLWLAVVDAGGRILHRSPGEPGRLRALSGQSVKIDQELSRFAWIEAERFVGVDLGKLQYETRIPFGDDEIRGLAELDQLRVFNAAGSSAKAPGVFEDRILDILPEIHRTMQGSVESTGLPDGLRRIHLELDIFLPPGIGGTGGGGVITLDNAVMYRYACAGDPLPSAYRHEYGHNMGFGHDPYMLIAEGGSATDEALYGKIGYGLLNAEAAARSIEYLLQDRGEDGLRWRPSASVFPALRAIYGDDIHKRMLTERRRSEKSMGLHGLTSIERIATLYSLVLDLNVAWIFRAHGWPVFDGRVDLGARAVKFLRTHPRQLNYANVPGTEITGWWVLDVDGEVQPPQWHRRVWPTANIDLVADGPPLERTKRWLLFRRIVVAKDTDARLLCASDCSLEVRVNGESIGVTDSSPQMSQPAHDELMLDQKRPFPVFLPQGENFIEVAIAQSPGSRGFVLALADPEGDPLRIGILDDGPPGETHSDAEAIEVADQVLLSGSFEEGIGPAWIEGATEPSGSLGFVLDTQEKVDGESSMRVDIRTPGAGAMIQRVFIPPGRLYDLRGAIRTEGFQGEAFIGLFTGELGGWKGRTEPVRKANLPWSPIALRWSPGPSRVVYVALYVKGTQGSVWFDGVQFTPRKGRR
jgi:pSer/pThr/pTyr-binding forkhead associated (FHA) protein